MAIIEEENISQVPPSFPCVFTSDTTSSLTAATVAAAPLAPAPPLMGLPIAKPSSEIGCPFGPPQQLEGAVTLAYAPRSLVSTAEIISPSINHSQFLPMQQTKDTTGKQQEQNAAMNPKPNYRNTILRSGKWTSEEEEYANILIGLFEEGRVDEFEKHGSINNDNGDNAKEGLYRQQPPPKIKITNGTTLRSYLSSKLFCSPMRISKKFAGRGIGKLVYMSQRPIVLGRPQQHQQQHQPIGFSSSIAYHNGTSPLLPAVYWNKFNQLKQAEMKFLRVAFPHGDPMEMYKTKKIHPALLKAKSPNYVSPNAPVANLQPFLITANDISPSTTTVPTENVPQTDLQSSCGPFQIQQNLTTLTATKRMLPTTNSNLGNTNYQAQTGLHQYQYLPQSHFGDHHQSQQQIHNQRHELHCPAIGDTLKTGTQNAPMPPPSSSQTAYNYKPNCLMPLSNNTHHQQHQQQQMEQQQQQHPQQQQQQIQQHHHPQQQQIQQQQQQLFNTGILLSQHQSNVSSVIRLDHKPAASNNDDNAPISSAIVKNVSPQASYNGYQGVQKPLPIMAAPRLSSPRLPSNNTIRPIFPALDGGTSQLQGLQHEDQKQKVQKQSKSQIEKLKEAYLISVSANESGITRKAPIGKNTTATFPTHLFSDTTTRDDSLSNQQLSAVPTQTSHVEHTVPRSEHDIRRNEMPTEISSLQYCQDFMISADKGSKPREISPINNIPPWTTASAIPSIDPNKIVVNSTKSQMNLPNFLSGFDKVTKQKQHNHPNSSVKNNTAGDLKHSAQFSPAYHTSQSFDDFHRYLGKGLSPAKTTFMKFPDLGPSNLPEYTSKNPGPVVPPFSSSVQPSRSKLQMRRRGQQDLASDLSSNETTISRSCVPIVQGKSDEILLNEAYKEAVGIFQSQQATQTPRIQGENNINSSDRCISLAKESVMASREHSAYNFQLNDQEPLSRSSSQQHHEYVKQTEFSLEDILLEDFDTLGSYPDTKTKLYDNLSDMTGVVSGQSDDCPSSTDRNSMSGEGGMSDESVGTLSEASSRYKKRKRDSLLGN